MQVVQLNVFFLHSYIELKYKEEEMVQKQTEQERDKKRGHCCYIIWPNRGQLVKEL